MSEYLMMIPRSETGRYVHCLKVVLFVLAVLVPVSVSGQYAEVAIEKAERQIDSYIAGSHSC